MRKYPIDYDQVDNVTIMKAEGTIIQKKVVGIQVFVGIGWVNRLEYSITDEDSKKKRNGDSKIKIKETR